MLEYQDDIKECGRPPPKEQLYFFICIRQFPRNVTNVLQGKIPAIWQSIAPGCQYKPL